MAKEINNSKVDATIAKFLGLPVTRLSTTFTSPQRERQVPIHYGFAQDIKWLMHVVEQIEAKGYCFKICRRRVEIDKDGEHGPFPWIVVKEADKQTSILHGILLFIGKYKP